MISACDVRLLGGFAVRVDGQSVSPDSWRSRRAADLVKLLALEPGHRMHREQAMDALWPDLSREAASANLRKAVHFARRTLGNPEAFSSQESMLDLWPSGPLGTDLDRFEHAASEALRSGDPQVCAAVAGAYGGDLLPADRYEPWTSDHRLAARQRYLSLLRAAGLWDRVLDSSLIRPTKRLIDRLCSGIMRLETAGKPFDNSSSSEAPFGSTSE
jgi:DNA-binding SARP family transcriptional activator